MNMAKGTKTHFPLIMPDVLSFQHRIDENECRIGKVYPVFVEVFAPFVFIPFKAHAGKLYECIYDVKRLTARAHTAGALVGRQRPRSTHVVYRQTWSTLRCSNAHHTIPL